MPGSVAEKIAAKAALVQTEVFPLTMFAIAGMMLFPAANDLLTMFVALEVFSLPLYLMCGLARRRRLLSQEAALKYFLLGAFSSAFFLYGIALLYGYSGTLSLPGIARAIDTSTDTSTLALVGAALVAVGVLFKVGAVPFHAWIPRRLSGRPHPDHRVHGRRNQGRRVRRHAADLLRRVARAQSRMAPPRPLGGGDPDHGRRDGHRGDPDRRQADARVFGCRACRFHPHRG